MRTVFAREERLVREHLGEDAADAPDVDRLVVALGREHYLRRAVPARPATIRELENCRDSEPAD